MSTRRRGRARALSVQPPLWENAATGTLDRETAWDAHPDGLNEPDGPAEDPEHTEQDADHAERVEVIMRETNPDLGPPAPTDAAAAGTRSSTRRRMPSFVCEVPLQVTPADERVLLARLEAARALYNACLSEARRRLRLVVESRAYQQARRLPKKSPERREGFQAARAAYAFSDAALQAYAKDCRHKSHWIEDHLDAPVGQKLASRAFAAVQRVAFHQAKHVRFKGKHQLDTVEGKSNETGLVWRSDQLAWKGLTLLAHLPKLRKGQDLKPTDPVLAHGLASRVKYVRLVRRKIRGQNRYFAQLICEGVPYQKPRHPLGEGIIGLDLGPSAIALTTPTEAALQPFCAELAPHDQAVRRQERHLDRQRRANNPDNYLPNGRVRPGRKGRKHWRESVRQRKTQARLADRQRRLAAQRKSLHGRLAHRLLREGNTVLLEKVSYRAWQRRFGRSVQRHAPGLFVTRLLHLAESAGAQVIQVPTRLTKLSQTCQCGQVKKKPLSLRTHSCEVCGVEMQRDLYSAYLIRFIDPESFLLHADQAIATWPRWEPIGRAAWQQAQSAKQPASAGATTRPRRLGSVRRRGAARAAELVARDRLPAKPKGPEGSGESLVSAGQRGR
ncbi:MAG: RNA-guided endonuclease InsQ/TnpB family protein [Ktedonobacterales bacterium]